MAIHTVRAAAFVVILGFAATLPGCGNGDSGTAPPPGTPPGNDTGNGSFVSTTAVSVADDVFNPQNTQVEGGATITWTWSGQNPHDVTWAEGGLDNSSTKSSGTHDVTMPSTAGDYVYYCTVHGSPSSGMRGVVRVQ